MRATILLLSAALTLCGTSALAQSSYNVVVEPVGQTVDAIINAPVEYDDNGVVKAQHFNARYHGGQNMKRMSFNVVAMNLLVNKCLNLVTCIEIIRNILGELLVILRVFG